MLSNPEVERKDPQFFKFLYTSHYCLQTLISLMGRIRKENINGIFYETVYNTVIFKGKAVLSH